MNKVSYSICCQGKIMDLSVPKVMGIINMTPDSFYANSRQSNVQDAVRQAEKMIKEGAEFLDLGAASTRPFSETVSEEEEIRRLLPAVKELSRIFPEMPLSIDTFRSEVARQSVEAGAAIINDISGGTMDAAMLSTVGRLKVPYIMMHTKGTPKDMQEDPSYENVTQEVIQFLATQIQAANEQQITDIITDPGFGFAKSKRHNYELLHHLEQLQMLKKPMLVGISRKRMIQEVLEVDPSNALNGTTVVNTLALLKGASILRVHDVKEAVECVKIVQNYQLEK